ncbi:hypothetical protein AB0L53_54970 [Nonomuraea sp. NPDC052129]|uniref:hypothetical protein n=1 Tax=Nonomuraea sp. NPDC052129 TaxID=3154651 RepID=UPI0034217580
MAVDDHEAGEILDCFRSEAGVRQAPEVKFRHIAGADHGRRRVIFSDLLGDHGALAGRASVYMVDKHFFITAKIIDLLLEEHAYARGKNLHAGGLARELARMLFSEGPRALKQEGFGRLISTMVDFASARNREGGVVSVDHLFHEINSAWAGSTLRKVSDLLFALRTTRSEAEEFLQHLGDGDIPAMEPLVPCVTAAIAWWANRLVDINVLTDEQRVLTDDRLSMIAKAAPLKWGPIRVLPGTPLRSLVRGVSKAHPSIQLADLVAGAGQAVARRHVGAPSVAGEELWQTIVPIITDNGMTSGGDPGRFAAVNP